MGDRLKSVAAQFRLELDAWKQLEREALAAEMHAAMVLGSGTAESQTAREHAVALRKRADDYLADIIGGTSVPYQPAVAVNDAGRALP